MQVCAAERRLAHENDEWVIYDGDGVNKSTNGTWILANSFYELKNDSVFKGAESLFKANIID